MEIFAMAIALGAWFFYTVWAYHELRDAKKLIRQMLDDRAKLERKEAAALNAATKPQGMFNRFQKD